MFQCGITYCKKKKGHKTFIEAKLCRLLNSYHFTHDEVITDLKNYYKNGEKIKFVKDLRTYIKNNFLYKSYNYTLNYHKKEGQLNLLRYLIDEGLTIDEDDLCKIEEIDYINYFFKEKIIEPTVDYLGKCLYIKQKYNSEDDYYDDHPNLHKKILSIFLDNGLQIDQSVFSLIEQFPVFGAIFANEKYNYQFTNDDIDKFVRTRNYFVKKNKWCNEYYFTKLKEYCVHGNNNKSIFDELFVVYGIDSIELEHICLHVNQNNISLLDLFVDSDVEFNEQCLKNLNNNKKIKVTHILNKLMAKGHQFGINNLVSMLENKNEIDSNEILNLLNQLIQVGEQLNGKLFRTIMPLCNGYNNYCNRKKIIELFIKNNYIFEKSDCEYLVKSNINFNEVQFVDSIAEKEYLNQCYTHNFLNQKDTIDMLHDKYGYTINHLEQVCSHKQNKHKIKKIVEAGVKPNIQCILNLAKVKYVNDIVFLCESMMDDNSENNKYI